MTGERNKIIWGEIVARAWRDAAFKQQLISNPKQVLSDAGMTVDEGVEVQIIEDTPTTRHLVFPVPPSGQSLSEEQLELVAGGGSVATSTNVAQTVEVATTEVEATETTTSTTAEVEAEVAAVVAGVIVLI